MSRIDKPRFMNTLSAFGLSALLRLFVLPAAALLPAYCAFAQQAEPVSTPQSADAAEAGAQAADGGDAGATAGGGRSPAPRLLDAMSVIGDHETPTALYIVPWRQSNLGALAGRPEDSLLDEVLAPVDPDVFTRRLDYYETLKNPVP